MFKTRRYFAAFVTATAAISFACGGGTDNTANKPGNNAAVNAAATSAQTNAEELGVLIRMPYETEDVVWKEKAAEKKLIAVLRFSPADADKVVAESGGQGTDAGSIAAEPWFPDELTAQAEMSGDNLLKGTAYPPTIFAQEPYTTGRVVRIAGSDYFIIELTKK